MFCPRCGEKNLEFFRFCSNCGYNLKDREFTFIKESKDLSSYRLVRLGMLNVIFFQYYINKVT